MLDSVQKRILAEVADLHETPIGAYNIRANGESAARNTTANVDIITKEDKSGIDVHILPFTKNESVHIPVVISESGITEVVYNDFYIGEGADVVIVAGCGIHNCGDQDSSHNGIHRFFLARGARIKYVEKHYGEGDGNGKNIMNPATEVYLEEDATMEMETVQIKGVDSTVRVSNARLGKDAKLIMTERLMTHGKQLAKSDMVVELNGEGSSAQIISRTVGKDESEQIFNPIAIGNNACAAHIQCDSIIMDNAKIRSIPEIAANHPDAQIVHEAAIGRINGDQLLKLCTLGLTEEEAEKEIIDGFLK